MDKTSTTTRGIGAALILLAAAIVAVPVLLHGLAAGDDFQFHLLSWLDAQQNWKHGIAYPHWAPNANYGAGEPRFIFYPPLTWMLGAALGSLLPWKLVPPMMLFVLLAATGFATRTLARERVADAPAALAGCIAILSGYALYTAYARAAFAELAGGFWVPLLLMFALRDRRPEAPGWRRALDGSTVPLALVVAGAWLSNVPVGIMASYLLAFVAVVVAIVARSVFPIVRAGVATVLGLGLTGCYLLPAVWEQRFVNPGEITDIPLFRIENHFLFPWHIDPVLSVHGVGLGFIVFLLAIPVMSVVAFVVRTRGCRSENRGWIALGVLPFVVLLLHLPVSEVIWRYAPRLRFMQYPWRLMLLLEAPTGIFLAAAVWPRRSGPLWQKTLVGVVCGMLLVGSAAFATRQFLLTRDQSGLAEMLSEYQAGGLDGIPEYSQAGWDDSLVATGLPDACLVTNPNIVLGAAGSADTNPTWSPEQGTCIQTASASVREPEHQRIAMTAPRPGWLILKLRSYPAWRITVNGKPAATLARDNDGLIAVPVGDGPVTVAVDWTTTTDAIVGRIVSALALALATCLYFLERRSAQVD